MNEVGPRLCVWGEGEESEGADGEEVRGSGDHLAQKQRETIPRFLAEETGRMVLPFPTHKTEKEWA